MLDEVTDSEAEKSLHRRILDRKPRHLLRFLREKCTVLYSDIDMVWLKDPFAQIAKFAGRELLLTNDDCAQRKLFTAYYCSCFLHAQPTTAVIGMVNAWLSRLKALHAAGTHDGDQPAFNYGVTAGSIPVPRVDFAVLPYAEFPPGCHTGDLTQTVLHVNWIEGVPAKVAALDALGFWMPNASLGDGDTGGSESGLVQEVEPELVVDRTSSGQVDEHSCWRGAFTYERCCAPPPDGDATCFDDQFTVAHCCTDRSELRKAGSAASEFSWPVHTYCREYGREPPSRCKFAASRRRRTAAAQRQVMENIEQEPEPRWSDEELKRALSEFAKVYASRPILANDFGMNANHAFALWFVVRALRPRHIIESGVWKGQGTWVLRQAVGPDAWIYSIDVRNESHLEYHEPASARTKYLMGENFLDFALVDWSSFIPSQEREQTLVVVDDHQSHLKRIHQILSLGFVHTWWDDNVKWGGDMYTINLMCSPVVPHGNDGIVYKDDFAAYARVITEEDHTRNLEYLTLMVEEYFDFPPIFDGCGWDSGAQLANQSQLRVLGLPSVEEEVYHYLHMTMPYVKLRSWPPAWVLEHRDPVTFQFL